MTPQEIMRRAEEVADMMRDRGMEGWYFARGVAKLALENAAKPLPDPWEKAVEAYESAYRIARKRLTYSIEDCILAGLKAAAPHIPGEK